MSSPRQQASGNLETCAPVPWDDPVPFCAPPPAPFPIEVLPADLQGFVRAVAEETQTPLELVAGLAITTVAAVTAGRTEVHIRGQWREPTNLFFLALMDPGERKSMVVKLTTKPLYEIEAELVSQARSLQRETRTQRSVIEEQLREVAQDAAKAEDDERFEKEVAALMLAEQLDATEVPPTPRLIVDDATPEALTSRLAEQGGRIALISSEGGPFEMLAGRYGAKTANLDPYLKGHAGDPLRVDRVNRPTEIVERPALTVGLTTQPDFMRRIGAHPDFRARGLLGRFLYVKPESHVGQRRVRPTPIPDDVLASYGKTIAALAQSLAQASNSNPHELTLAEDALDRLLQLAESLEPRLGPGGDLSPIADWANKLVGATARIAANLHLVETLRSGWGDPISAATVRSAIRISECFLSHAIAVFDLIGTDDVRSNAHAVSKWLQRTRPEIVTKREVHRAHQSRFSRASDVDEVLAELEGRGWLRYRIDEDDGSGRRGRPRSPSYDVNPTLDSGGGL